MSNKEILKYGVVYYFQKIDKNVSEQRYEPVSYEMWKMLRAVYTKKSLGDKFGRTWFHAHQYNPFLFIEDYI
jgi:hypothetical protein